MLDVGMQCSSSVASVHATCYAYKHDEIVPVAFAQQGLTCSHVNVGHDRYGLRWVICRSADQTAQGYALTRLTSLLAQLIDRPGASAKFARGGLLGQALLALAGLTAVEVARTHLTGWPWGMCQA